MAPTLISPPLTPVMERATEILQQSGILHNPFFRSLKSGELTLEQFQQTQEQFYFAVLDFPRAMLLLLARLPGPRQRLTILDNVLEEHGRFDSSAFHEATFRRFLAALGVRDFDPSRVERGPQVDAFLLALMAACHFEPIEVGTASLGIIELAFADISANIGRAVVERGFIPANRLVHYDLHADIDKDHAAGIFSVIEPHWSEPASRSCIEQGLHLGAFLFDRFYRDLWESIR